MRRERIVVSSGGLREVRREGAVVSKQVLRFEPGAVTGFKGLGRNAPSAQPFLQN